jgi:hypothetical protein
MKRPVAALFVLALAAACDHSSAPQPAAPASSPGGRLEQLVASNATVVGYLYTADKPFVVASFQSGSLQWRHDPESKSIIQGPAEPFALADRACIGFSAKNPSMPAQGPERYLVCEALRPIEHHNSLPRSQDFRLQPGTMFIEYEPPAGTGYAQLFYASVTK